MQELWVRKFFEKFIRNVLFIDQVKKKCGALKVLYTVRTTTYMLTTLDSLISQRKLDSKHIGNSKNQSLKGRCTRSQSYRK